MEEIQMVNQKIQDRLAALRAVMKENGVDWYMVPQRIFTIRNMWTLILR